MAIVRVTGGGGLERRVGLKAAKKAAKKGSKKGAKKGAKHAIEKLAAKKGAKHAIAKHAAKKQAAKHPGKKAGRHAAEHSAGLGKQDAKKENKPKSHAAGLARAFHHLRRSEALISLLEKESGGDLRALLERGVEVYRTAAEESAEERLVRQAIALLRAIEHLGMAGLYSARAEFRAEVEEPQAPSGEERRMSLRARLEDLGRPEREDAEILAGLAWELLRRADAAEDDPHLEFELAMAADGVCAALEHGL